MVTASKPRSKNSPVVGLFLAIELAVAGVRPLVVEHLAEPDRTIKAAGVGAVAVEALQRRGLARALEEEHRAAMALFAPALRARVGSAPLKRPGGHFSALFLIDQDLQRDPERHMRAVPQEALEKMLEARVIELGVEIRRGVTVEGLEQEDDAVTVQTSAGPLRAKYLVGCDGGRSRVRKLAGFELVGTESAPHRLPGRRRVRRAR